MVRVVIYSDLEKAILRYIKIHLEREFKKINVEITGGIHVRPKPKSARLDSIELNTSGLELLKKSDHVGFMNINYQDDDKERVEEFTYFIGDLMDSAIIHRYHFKQSHQEIFRISPYLWMGNNMYQLTLI